MRRPSRVTRIVRIGLSLALLVFFAAVPRAWLSTNDVTTGKSPEYPDLQDRRYDFPPDETVAVADQVARRIPRWQVVSTDKARRTVQVLITTAFGGFKDDMTILILPEGKNSRVTIRSHSRIGRSDLGENARHIRALQSAMDTKLPRLP